MLRPYRSYEISQSLCLGTAGDGPNLRVEVCAVLELFHHDGARVMQQRLLVDRVLHFWNFLQVAQFKALCLYRHKYIKKASVS